ncbi:MAG: hypothetical protein DMG05_25210 [Acidobacteria bacterium]|nr:MAG: hypothetical protein DMG05_25210 [Acidobacteriota bacterium]
MKCRGVFLISIFIAALLLSSTPVSAEDPEFGLVVRQVESYFHVKRTHIPLLGFMKPVLWIARPAGAKSVEIAIFEDQDFSRGLDDPEFEKLINQSVGQNWQPLVRVHSRRDREQTTIYARDMGKNFKLMIITLEPSEAVVTQVKLSFQELIKCLENPERMGKRGQIEE